MNDPVDYVLGGIGMESDDELDIGPTVTAFMEKSDSDLLDLVHLDNEGKGKMN
jgi:hypothetical protein